jgi:hypothetical protein
VQQIINSWSSETEMFRSMVGFVSILDVFGARFALSEVNGT